MKRYQQFVSEAYLDYSPRDELKQQIYLESEQFIDRAQSNINLLQDFSAIPSLQYSPTVLPYELAEILRDFKHI
jgi:hypothetical protein